VDEAPPNDWKLKLRYGKLKTPYSHFSVVAEGEMTAEENEFGCPVGNAIMGMKVWASSSDEAGDMIRVIGEQLSFSITGRTYVYDTEPEQPPREHPHGYDIQFTPFQDDEEESTG
jgi:hypothetical protein